MKSFFEETKIDEKNKCSKQKGKIFSVAAANTYLIFYMYLIYLTVGLPEGVENNHLIELNLKNGPPQNHHTICYTTHVNYYSSKKHQRS